MEVECRAQRLSVSDLRKAGLSTMFSAERQRTDAAKKLKKRSCSVVCLIPSIIFASTNTVVSPSFDGTECKRAAISMKPREQKSFAGNNRP